MTNCRPVIYAFPAYLLQIAFLRCTYERCMQSFTLTSSGSILCSRLKGFLPVKIYDTQTLSVPNRSWGGYLSDRTYCIPATAGADPQSLGSESIHPSRVASTGKTFSTRQPSRWRNLQSSAEQTAAVKKCASRIWRGYR